MRCWGSYGWQRELRGARASSEVVSKMCKGALGKSEGPFNLHPDYCCIFCIYSPLFSGMSSPSAAHLSTTIDRTHTHHLTLHLTRSPILRNSHYFCASSVARGKGGNRRRGHRLSPFLLLRHQSSCHKAILPHWQQQCCIEAAGITSLIVPYFM